VQRPELRHDLVDVSTGQIHIEQAAPRDPSGEQPPTLVLLPQWPFGAWHYRNALPLLARTFRPIAVDLPGFGWSTAPEEPLTVDDLACVLAELIAALGLRDVTVLARAASTAVAVRLASHVPLAGLILHGPFAHSAEQRAAKLQHTWRPIARSADSGHLVQAWERVASRYPDLPPELLTRCAIAHIDAAEVQAAAYQDVWRTDTLAGIAELRVPTCAFVGRDEVLTYCFDNLPANVVRVDGPGLAGPSDHLPWTGPADFTDLVEEAFASLRRGR
jgi:pimeloyl-ACP methyl ester carboxylesterase